MSHILSHLLKYQFHMTQQGPSPSSSSICESSGIDTSAYIKGTASLRVCLVEPTILDLIPEIPYPESQSKQIISEVDELINLFRLGGHEGRFPLSDDEIASLLAKKAMELVYLKQFQDASGTATTAFNTMRSGETTYTLGCALYCVG